MMHTMFACLNKIVQEQLKVKKAVYRDELITKKKPPTLPSKAVKKSVRFADSDPSIFGEDHNEKKLAKGRCSGGDELGGIRVKLKMTKDEAARLLSKCKEGGVLEFKDVARELVALPLNRVSVVSVLHER
ncbi:hypothetical protein AAZX31_01G211200 [Glycine max]|uniref:DUF7890 domain-containing protein n=2 Tax=Glycine subgen. Soja TaxID=1462606 RepID=I1JAD9_SOYBN|nr:uncharacterized protein LOC102660531 [Glycine max]XP_028248171.1 uncharacterized protein LOC114425438 [Glycine soja]KAG5061553.1 hypothetical protein JHK87_002582 [Glycine soja]KAG5089976.1 hypothetical protein JHK86_002588 [Glycine max]KAH1267615.1 hypothetical protein GmHk_01G002804 [Glycine max]KHN25645.1 hypothetical protein glysoja_018219 [Glycine soja]KRH77646.1 hypothetical protein GLYMA_01G225500v4 [Glycine max]|eukprot:XP_006573809.1 uncharacterized protein LOC102660531 [Glycine max]